ncbi:MAG: glycoside hydrolase 43 family protein, partial [Burkholderiales bacterium]|nr:glycoside hydrolase 43 family protein [Opitutaceae bacterium]
RRARVEFTGPGLPAGYHTLREPGAPDWLRFDRTPGSLSLRGRDSLASNFDQSLVARRLEHLHARATTRLRFAPRNFKQAAGLIAYYDRLHYHYFRVTGAGPGRAKLGVYTSAFDKLSRHEVAEFSLEETAAGLDLHIEMKGTELRFAWRTPDGPWQQVERVFESTQVGDWAAPGGGFTGTFWGVCCQDLAERSAWADFAFFDYRPI